MEVKKVKRLNGKTTVEWTEPNGRHNTESALNDCPDKPSEAFLAALARVEADLVARAKGRITFQPSAPDADRASEYFTLTGVSMTRNSAGRRQFNASAKINFGFGETGLSLPLLLEPDSEKPSGADNVLSDLELSNIEELFAEGLKYAEGEREQGTLDLEDKKGDQKAA